MFRKKYRSRTTSCLSCWPVRTLFLWFRCVSKHKHPTRTFSDQFPKMVKSRPTQPQSALLEIRSQASVSLLQNLKLKSLWSSKSAKSLKRHKRSKPLWNLKSLHVIKNHRVYSDHNLSATNRPKKVNCLSQLKILKSGLWMVVKNVSALKRSPTQILGQQRLSTTPLSKKGPLQKSLYRLYLELWFPCPQCSRKEKPGLRPTRNKDLRSQTSKK